MFNFPKSFIDTLIGDDYSWWEEAIFQKKVTLDFMQYLSEILLPCSCIAEVREAIHDGMDEDNIKKFAKKDYSQYQMVEIRKGLKLGKDYYKKVDIYCNPQLTHHQMEVLYRGIRLGLSTDQLKSIANPQIPAPQMYKQVSDFNYSNKFKTLTNGLNNLT